MFAFELNRKGHFFAAMLIRPASQAHDIPCLPVEQPTVRSRVKRQGGQATEKQNTIACLYSLAVLSRRGLPLLYW